MAKLPVEADQIVVLWKEGKPDCALPSFVSLTRFLAEQIIIRDGVRQLRTKEDGGMHSGMLQNPSDPEATFRKKAGKEHRGRVANFEESVGRNGSVITDYAVEANNVSDLEMLEHKLKGMEPQEKEVTVVTDGGYASDHVREVARGKNVRILNTNLTGKKARDICADGTAVTMCPCGHAPSQCAFYAKGEYCRITMDASHCLNCPHREECRPVFLKNTPVAKLSISYKQRNHAVQMREMSTEEEKAWPVSVMGWRPCPRTSAGTTTSRICLGTPSVPGSSAAPVRSDGISPGSPSGRPGVALPEERSGRFRSGRCPQGRPRSAACSRSRCRRVRRPCCAPGPGPLQPVW